MKQKKKNQMTFEAQERTLRATLRRLEKMNLSSESRLRDSVPGQPLDRHLLKLSSLYRLSRRLFLQGGGEFRPALVSSPRTLSSPILLEPLIEYTPSESELFWAALNPAQRRDSEHLFRVRTYSASLFHEQNHRILWRLLPCPPTGDSLSEKNALHRYLNWVESLVVGIDMALGDELGRKTAEPFYLSGVIYDPGSDLRSDLGKGGKKGLRGRQYRNYLQAAIHATYLYLEFYDPDEIPRAIHALFPMLGEPLATRVSERACRLDPGFVRDTNPKWQKRHLKITREKLSKLPGTPLFLPSDPLDNRQQYLFVEKWLDHFKI